jgi:hypothetical protein
MSFKQYLIEGITYSQKKAEDVFCFGHCRSFAYALHSKIGGEIRSLLNRGKEYHVYVHKDGDDYDVKGKRSTGSMALGLTGSIDGWTKGETIEPENMKTSPKMIDQALKYIDDNKKKFGIT